MSTTNPAVTSATPVTSFYRSRFPISIPRVNESRLARIAKELEQSGFVTFESLHQRKDGSTYPVEINLKRVELDRAYLVNVVRDITERKRVEEALRQKSDELAEAQRLAGLGSWRVGCTDGHGDLVGGTLPPLRT